MHEYILLYMFVQINYTIYLLLTNWILGILCVLQSNIDQIKQYASCK